MNSNPRSWLDRLLELAVGLVMAGLLLTWAWSLLRPLVPVLMAGVGVVATIGAILRHQRGRW